MIIRKVFLALLLSVSLSSCSNDEAQKFQKEFYAGCQSSGAPKSLCNCMYSKLVDTYTEDGLGELSASNSFEAQNRLSTSAVKAAEQCREELAN